MGRGCLAAMFGIALASPAKAAPRALEAPAWLTHGPLGGVAFPGADASVTAAWSPVVGAAHYRVRWAGASTVEVETRDTHVSREVAPGDYQVTLVAVDRSGSEGHSSVPLAIHVSEIRAIPPGATTPAPPTRGAYAIGTRFEHCRLPGTAPTHDFIATQTGAIELECDAGDARVVIAPVVVAADETALPRGRTTTVHLAIASVAALGDKLEVAGTGDLAVVETRRTPRGVDVDVTAAPGARTAALAVQSRGETLARVDLGLTDPAPEPAVTATAPDWLAIDAGGQLGGLWLPEGPATVRLGHTPGEALISGALLGATVGFYPLRRVGIEGQLGVVASAEGGDRAMLIASRGQLAVRALEDRRVGVRLIAGAGALSLIGHGTAGEVHAGVAMTVETATNWWVRLQIADVVTTAVDAGYSHCPELQLGLVTRIGRRDRW